MLFHRKQKHFDKISVVIEIEHVPSFNFLGIMLDENLSWKSHIEMVGNKISKVTGILYRLKNVFPENVLFVLYNSLIVSYINYMDCYCGGFTPINLSYCKREHYVL